MRIELVAVASVVAALTIPIAGPAIEARTWPVLTDAEVIGQEKIGDQVYFLIEAMRKRPSCMYQDVVAKIEQQGQATKTAEVETPFSGRRISRPPGRQYMGSWKVPKPPNPDGVDMTPGTIVTFFVRYQCHVLWDTMARIGPVRVE